MPKKQTGRGLSASKPKGQYDTIIYNIIRYMNELNAILKKYGIKEELTIEKYATDENYINNLKTKLMKLSQNKIADQQDLIEFGTKLGLIELELGRLNRKSQSQRGGSEIGNAIISASNEIKDTETYKNLIKDKELYQNAKNYYESIIKIKDLNNKLEELTNKLTQIQKDRIQSDSNQSSILMRFKNYKTTKETTNATIKIQQNVKIATGSVLISYFVTKDDINSIIKKDKYNIITNHLDLLIYKLMMDLFKSTSVQSPESVSVQPPESAEPVQKLFIVGGKSKPKTRKPRTVKK